jgi:hypothetical protein
MKRRPFALVLVLTTLLGGCGGSDSTAPNPTANVSGTWTASLSNMSGSGASCSTTESTTLTLDQDGTTFSGHYSGGELTCTGPGGTSSDPVGTGTIINGNVSGNRVSFDLDTPDFHLTGTISGNSMSGTARWVIDLGSQVVTLNGNWGASK